MEAPFSPTTRNWLHTGRRDAPAGAHVVGTRCGPACSRGCSRDGPMLRRWWAPIRLHPWSEKTS